jgi:hypothetical protein
VARYYFSGMLEVGWVGNTCVCVSVCVFVGWMGRMLYPYCLFSFLFFCVSVS